VRGVVANHAATSTAWWPPRTAAGFCIRDQEGNGAGALASLLLRRLARNSSNASTGTRRVDARRVLKSPPRGQSLCSFRGHFDETRQIGKFLGGAFATAARSQMPVVAVGSMARAPFCRRAHIHPPTAIRVEIMDVMDAAEAKVRCRELIAAPWRAACTIIILAILQTTEMPL